MKAILLICALLLVYWWFWGRRAQAQRGTAPPRRTAKAEKMVHCAYCGLHVPESESVIAAGHYFCCDEHRQLGAP